MESTLLRRNAVVGIRGLGTWKDACSEDIAGIAGWSADPIEQRSRHQYPRSTANEGTRVAQRVRRAECHGRVRKHRAMGGWHADSEGIQRAEDGRRMRSRYSLLQRWIRRGRLRDGMCRLGMMKGCQEIPASGKKLGRISRLVTGLPLTKKPPCQAKSESAKRATSILNRIHIMSSD
jgi:hypothetical protein